jgi:alanyl-tRNA synthetase
MNIVKKVSVFGSLVALGLFAMITPEAKTAFYFEDAKEVNAAISKLVGKTSDTKAIAELAKKYSLDELMHAFKLRAKGGFGVGETAGAITPDGIEAKLQGLQKKEADKADLAKNGKAYATIGEVSLVLAELSEKDPKKWLEFVEKMRKGSKDLIVASNKSDAKGLKVAAKVLNDSCVECHGIFRD